MVLVLIYVAARATLHGNAVAKLDAHTYRAESPRRLAAFADPVSLVTWRGVVETTTQICTVSVPAAGARFDPESGVCLYKPEDLFFCKRRERTENRGTIPANGAFPEGERGNERKAEQKW